MSTFRHHVDLNPFWYVAVAAAAAITGFLLFVLLGAASHSTSPAPTYTPPLIVHGNDPYEPITKACFALPPQASIELARAGCASGLR